MHQRGSYNTMVLHCLYTSFQWCCWPCCLVPENACSMPGDNIKAASLQSFVVTAVSPQHCLLGAGLSLLPEGNNQSQETASKLPDVSSELPSWRWWTARVLSVNQRLLARSAASLRSALQTVMPQVPMLAISMHALSHAASPRHSSHVSHPHRPDKVLMPETKDHIPVTHISGSV